MSLQVYNVCNHKRKGHKLFSATYILCSKIIGNKKIEGSSLNVWAVKFMNWRRNQWIRLPEVDSTHRDKRQQINNITYSNIHYFPVIGTVRLTGTQLQSSLTGLLVIRTMLFCPDNECPVNEDYPQSSLSGQVLFCSVNGCRYM